MKNQPELPNRSGKSTLTLRNFLNNLKENDLHYDNKQITQCVFLGVLRLKPVPSIFSQNNVPSGSAPVENNKPKNIRNNNSNKRPNKNVSNKNYINKVLSGKVTKKNPQKVKSAVKKVPDKKPSFKIKLHTKKKTSKLKKNVQQSPNNKQNAPTNIPESSQALPCDPVPSTPTIGLNPLASPAKFNPVQNLFDKLKQKIDSGNCEPGPSTVAKQTDKIVDSAGPSGVCKINAKRETNPTNRKPKKTVQRKPVNLEPTSPITISDSDSTGKKDNAINVDGHNFFNSREVEDNTEKGAMEDVIFVNEDPKPIKHKERTSPRSKITTLTHNKEVTTDNFELHGVMVINDEQKSMKGKRRSPPKLAREKGQSSDIIVIPDEPKPMDIASTSTTNKAHNNSIEKDNDCNSQEGFINDVIVIDEIRELRVSPRMKSVEVLQEKTIEVQSSNPTHEAVVDIDEVIVRTGGSNRIPEMNKMHTAGDEMENLAQKSARDDSKTQALNISIDDCHTVKNKGKSSPRLLKIVENDDKTLVAVQKELIQPNEEEVIVVNEKPKQRKPKPPLIPPMFLNAPMLLRSELAPRKATPSVCEKPKRKDRSKLLRSDMPQTKSRQNSPVTVNETNYFTTECEKSNISKRRSSKFLWPELSNKIKSEKFTSQASSVSEDVIFVADQSKNSNHTSSRRMPKLGRPLKVAKVNQTNLQEIDLATEVENHTADSLRRSDLVDITPESLQSNVQESKMHGDIIILNEEPFEEQIYTERQTTSTRLLRSELAQQKSPGKEHLTRTRQKSAKTVPGMLDEDDEIKPIKNSPRLLRSDLIKQKNPDSEPTYYIEAPKSDKEVFLPGQAVAEISDNLNSHVTTSDLGNKRLKSDKDSNIQHIEQSSGEIKDVMVVKDEPKSKRVSPRTLRPEQIKVESPEPNKTEEILVINNDRCATQKEKLSPRLLRSDIAQQKTRPKSLQRNKQIDLDEIIVVSERRVKKPKERTISGRLLRSELALQKSRELLPVKAEVEEVVVLIHDEPKPKQKTESLQTCNKKINIQEQVIVLADEPPRPSKKASPRCLRSDTNQKHSPDKTPPETIHLLSDDTQEGAKAENPRSEQNVYNLPNEESRNPIEKQNVPESGSSSKKYPELVTKDQLVQCSKVEVQTSSSTSPKSAASEPNPESPPAEKQKLIKSEIAARRSPRARDQPGNVGAEQEEVEQPTTPSRLLRSQHSPRNLLGESAECVDSQNLLISEVTKKTSPRFSKTLKDAAEDVKLATICASGEDIGIKSEFYSSRLLRSDIVSTKGSAKPNEQSAVGQAAKKSPSKQRIDVVDVCVQKQSSPRSLRSETSSQKSPTVLSKQQSANNDAAEDISGSDITTNKNMQEPPTEAKTKRGRPRKTQSLLLDTKANLKTPMLLRSELAQLKNLNADTTHQEQGMNATKKRGRKPKVTSPPSKVEVPIQEPLLNMQSSKGKPPKRKSLIDDLKRNTSPKQKAIAMRSLSSPEIISESKTVHGKRAKSQVVTNEKGRETVDNNLPSNELEAQELDDLKAKNSQLAQFKNLNADTSNQEQGPKPTKKRGRKPKVTSPLSNVDIPMQEPLLNVQTGKGKPAKRKSLIDDLKRKTSPKQKAIAMQNLNSPEIISEPKTVSGKRSESQIVTMENTKETELEGLKTKKSPKQKAGSGQNLSSPKIIPEPTISEELSGVQILNIEDSKKTATIVQSPSGIDENVKENSTGVIGRPNNKARDAPKSPRRKNSPKQKSIATQNLSGPRIISEPAIISESPINSTDNKETVANIPSSSVLVIEENSTILNCNSKAQNGVKSKQKVETIPSIDKAQSVIQQMNIKGDPGVESIECPPEFDLEKTPEKDLQKNVTKHPLKPKTRAEVNPLKRRSKSKEPPTSVKPKFTKIKNTVARSSPEVDLVSEEPSPEPSRKRTYAKRKPKVTKAVELSPSPEVPASSEFNVNKTPEKAPKQIDTTVFDFDETEPEVVPLRLSSPRRNRKVTPEDSKEPLPSNPNMDNAPKLKKRKLNKTNTDDSKTKAQAKAKLLAMFGDKSPQQDRQTSPEKPKGKSTKTKCASKTSLNKEQSENSKNVDKTDASPARTATSPMKQSTITDLFSKAIVKKEKAALAESVFGPAPSASPPEEPLKETTNDNTKTDMAPPKAERKVNPSANVEEENELYDDDSDCESRAEWMPEEYAEYKFKYSAKKMMSYKPIFKCKICLLILPTYYRLFRHKEEHAKTPNPYNCPQCEMAFPSIDELTAHLRVHKGKHPYTCSKCDIGFWSKKSLDAHTPVHILKKVKQRNKRFRCDVCAREFSKLCDMERHTRVHTGEKPCVCNICNKRFQQSHNLSKHLLTHLHVKPFHCEICNMQFGRNDVLNRHLLIHSVDKPIKCALCSKGFIRKSQLNNHMVKIHPDVPRTDTMAETSAEAAN